MPPIPSRAASASRIRWAQVLLIARWVATQAERAWRALTPRERDELRALLEKSRGRRSNLTFMEQKRVRQLVMRAVKNLSTDLR